MRATFRSTGNAIHVLPSSNDADTPRVRLGADVEPARVIGPGADQVRAASKPGTDDVSLWVGRPRGDRYQIVSAVAVCMTVVHDAAPGSVRGRGCDPAAETQLFRIDQVPDGSYSIFQGKRYIQVVDGTNALVPDLPEGLTTTYEFEDRGPAPS
ncbi:hypothetical protein HNR22_003695 [Micromonospora jinlongensis]|uniref:Uncharacterized protein n=1 Tax=Micromonospora jinlongensis TaxID=1287877 RepID=A0A7Y9X2S9_9ACTN|nr:hypothetical protein [Micromonospora jinlongensis]NYH43968.1 hypothetical protein [Micromonospora jinlongensis]